jgi:formylglycine-generating enzyme required for sulfatase activity
LERLRAQYIPEDAKDAEVSDRDRIRRYQSILREGAWAERQYPTAPNLYQVRALMMAAAKGLVTLESSAEARQSLVDIASRLAGSEAPAEARLPAEMILFRVRLEELGDAPAEAAEEIALFARRYDGTPAQPQALMAAYELGQIASARTGRKEYLNRLMQKHYREPGVAEFLEAHGMRPYLGRLLSAALTKLDGTPLALPRDTMGKFIVLHFWTMARPELVTKRSLAGAMAPAYGKLRQSNVEFIGVNLDTDPAKVRQFAEERAFPWPQTCSGLGPADPLFRRCRVPVLPAWWLIAPDGRVLSNSYSQGDHTQDWAGFGGHVENMVGSLSEMAARGPYYRSGEFLIGVAPILPAVGASAGPGLTDVPEDRLFGLREKVFLPPSLGLSHEEKAKSLRLGMQLARAAERDHPQAGNLTVVRNWALVAARWLGAEAADSAAADEGRKLAAAVMARGAKDGSDLLADYVLTSAELAQALADKAGERIESFRRRYAHTGVNWAADVLAVVLAIECGDEDARVATVRSSFQHAPAQPKVRGFLRDYVRAPVDSRASPFQYWPVETLAAGGVTAPVEPAVPKMTLPLLNGGALRLGDETRGRAVVIQFWSSARPPVPLSAICGRRGKPGEPLQDGGALTVAVNLDASRAAAERFAPGDGTPVKWLQVFSGKGWDDPLARELDIYDLPRALVLDTTGAVYRWGTPTHLGDAAQRAATPPQTFPVTPPPPSTTPAANAPPAVPVEEPPKELRLDLGGQVAVKLTLIAPGPFRMGPSGYEVRQYDDEPANRLVILTKPYYMALHPITRGQFAAFAKDAKYTTEAEREGWSLAWGGSRWDKVAGASWRKPGFDQDDDHPVVCVTFNDATEFCGWLSRRCGKTVQVPTEAQWEYACRAGCGAIYPWGDDPDAGAGWCNAANATVAGASPRRSAFGFDDGYPFTSPVGKFKPNAFGLYDMIGNVWEWTPDWFDKGLYWSHEWRANRYDPAGPSAGSHKAVKGGSWQDGPDQCRSAARRPQAPVSRLNTLGFRIAITLPCTGPPPATRPLP